MATYSPFCKKQANYIKRCLDNNVWLSVAEGGKRASKNIINVIAWCSILETHPDKLHLAAGVSVATAKLNIIDSNGFGVLNYFKGRCRQGKYQDRDALYIQTKTGEKIILISGGGKNGDERFIKGLTLGTVYISEVNECAQSFVKEVFDRTTTSSLRKIIFDLNPKSELHWFYTEVLDVHQAKTLQYENYGLNYEHFTIHDNLSRTNEQIKETIRTYDKKSIWYQRDILGLRKNAEGVIYDMWDEEENSYGDTTRPVNLERGNRRYVTIDYGTQNPMAFLDAYDDGETIWVDNEYYYSGRAESSQKTDSQYADDLINFIGYEQLDNGEKLLRSIAGAIIDPSAASFKAELFQRHVRTKDADNTVLDGIRMVANMIQKRRIKVHKRCVNFRKEIAAYIWDEKKAKNGEDIPLKESDHLMDCIRYLIKTIILPRRAAR